MQAGYGKEAEEGDDVTWRSLGQTVEGSVENRISDDTQAAGRTVRASDEEPQYLVKSDRTSREAVHKPDALHEPGDP